MATDKPADMQELVVKSAKFAADTLRRLFELPTRVKLVEEETRSLEWQLSKIGKARDSAVVDMGCRLRQMSALVARVRMFCDELYLLKRRETMNCDLKVTTCMVSNSQNNISNLVTALHQNTMSTYHFILCNVNSFVVEVSERLRRLLIVRRVVFKKLFVLLYML